MSIAGQFLIETSQKGAEIMPPYLAGQNESEDWSIINYQPLFLATNF